MERYKLLINYEKENQLDNYIYNGFDSDADIEVLDNLTKEKLIYEFYKHELDIEDLEYLVIKQDNHQKLDRTELVNLGLIPDDKIKPDYSSHLLYDLKVVLDDNPKSYIFGDDIELKILSLNLITEYYFEKNIFLFTDLGLNEYRRLSDRVRKNVFDERIKSTKLVLFERKALLDVLNAMDNSDYIIIVDRIDYFQESHELIEALDKYKGRIIYLDGRDSKAYDGPIMYYCDQVIMCGNFNRKSDYVRFKIDIENGKSYMLEAISHTNKVVDFVECNEDNNLTNIKKSI